jgi:hypothetical protein
MGQAGTSLLPLGIVYRGLGTLFFCLRILYKEFEPDRKEDDMKFKVMCFCLMMALTFVGLCQEQEDRADARHYIVNVSVFYPFSFNRTRNDTTNVNLSLVYGHVGGVKGLDLSLMVSAVSNKMTGVQITGLAAIVGESFSGLQLSGLFNITGEHSGGVQSAGIFNISGNRFSGIQASGIFNVADARFSGIQSAGIFNVVGEKMSGAQLSTINFVGSEFRGLQAGTINFVGETFSGGQLGLVNYTANLRGFQFGAVNLGLYVNGLQLGLINVSNSIRGVPVGLVNISRDGYTRWVSWGSNLTAVNVGLKSVVRNFYSIVSIGGVNLEKEIDRSIAYGFHYGVHVPLRRFYADVDLGYVNIDNDKFFRALDKNPDQHVLMARAMLGINISRHFSLFVGGGVGYMLDHRRDFNSGQYIPILLGGIELFKFSFLPRIDQSGRM